MVEYSLLGSDLKRLMVIENYQSIIWAERYNEPGDFEIYTADISNWMTYLQGFIRLCTTPDGSSTGLDSIFFISKSNSDTLMIIEDVKITTDVETGSFLTITGRSLESILDRRIVFPSYQSFKLIDRMDPSRGYEYVSLLPWEGIKDVVDYCQTIPYYPGTGYIVSGASHQFEARRMFLSVVEPTDERFTNPRYVSPTGYTYDKCTLYDAVKDICDTNGYGFYIRAEYVNNHLEYKLYLYMGVNKSSVVKFSPKYDNFINCELSVSSRNIRNAACVYEPSTHSATFPRGLYYTANDWTFGIVNREAILDETENFYFGDGTDLTQGTSSQRTDYSLNLRATQREELKALQTGDVSFDGQAETSVETFKIGVDYTLGDLVTVENEFGLAGITQVMAITESFDDSNGHQLYPTFGGFIASNVF